MKKTLPFFALLLTSCQKAVVVYSIKDILGLIFLAIVLLTILSLWVLIKFEDWRTRRRRRKGV